MIRKRFSRTGYVTAALALVAGSAGLGVLSTAVATDRQEAPVQLAEQERVVNLYSYRQPFLINPILARFTKETGIKVNVVYAPNGIVERLKAEGRNTPADAVLTVDIGRLDALKQADVLQSVRSNVLDRNIPRQYRHPDGLWFGLTTRARVIYAHKTRVKKGEVTSYDDLARPHMKGRVCTRSGKHDYTVALLASILQSHGRDYAEDWARKVKGNLARRPQGNDRAQVKAIYAGECDVSLGNTYYMGKMAANEKNPEQKEWAAAVRILFPDQNDRGTHVNISGVGVTKHAKNKADAVRLIEFLSADLAQGLYADVNFEYPVKSGVKWHPMVESWGKFKSDSVSLEDVARNRAIATKIMDRVGFDK